MQCFSIHGQPVRCPSICSQTHEIKEQFDGIAERAFVRYFVVAVLLSDLFTLIPICTGRLSIVVWLLMATTVLAIVVTPVAVVAAVQPII